MISVSQYRALVDRFPTLGLAYRNIRDALFDLRERKRETMYGFSLIGEPFTAAGKHEPEAMKAFIESDFDMLIDVGANVGFYTCLAASRGKSVIAIEPLPRNIRYLRQNLANNHFENVEIYPIAVGNAPGVMKLYGRYQGASLIPHWGKQPTFDYHEVEVRTLDQIVGACADKFKVFVKIDVEGAEHLVLAGAERLLSRSPVVMMEVAERDPNQPTGINPHFDEVMQVMADKEYSRRQLDAVNWIFTKP
jgi:FkbM family methyltransferase